jgi:hypothetical protein
MYVMNGGDKLLFISLFTTFNLPHSFSPPNTVVSKLWTFLRYISLIVFALFLMSTGWLIKNNYVLQQMFLPLLLTFFVVFAMKTGKGIEILVKFWPDISHHGSICPSSRKHC